ncbi:Aste57867_23462 [Aphanomyces stellatus]|uniref:Aste57867_23462 protein n=1 Tax=Aphanomyces stellatus TaxID=120398 RepID=A0A485LNT0_9STRA|nr:hypothetical protein As57867_023391 [Aphanomyces stellatus]VFU00107.1 Aste57867_23462 [Aphanomyces stellatus]
MAARDMARAALLREWIHEALLKFGFMSASAPTSESIHGMYPPMEYMVGSSRLLLRGILIKERYLLHCERSGDASTSWRVDFPLKGYVPLTPRLYPMYRTLVHWRVETSLVHGGDERPPLPDFCIDAVVSFLDVSSLLSLRTVSQAFCMHVMQPDVWRAHLLRDFPRMLYNNTLPPFNVYLEGMQQRKARRQAMLGQMLLRHEGHRRASYLDDMLLPFEQPSALSPPPLPWNESAFPPPRFHL